MRVCPLNAFHALSRDDNLPEISRRSAYYVEGEAVIAIFHGISHFIAIDKSLEKRYFMHVSKLYIFHKNDRSFFNFIFFRRQLFSRLVTSAISGFL